MKNKSSLLFILTIALAAALVSYASAQGAPAGKPDKAGGPARGKVTQGKNGNMGTDSVTQTADPTANQEIGKKNNIKNDKGQLKAETHRSTVANFVQGLLSVADREGGIGQQVRVIAHQQNDLKEKTAEQIKEVESRSKIKTFFFGSDYKNLGDLRSQMVQTRNQIAQLSRLADSAANDQDKAELQLQIKNLNQEQADIESFIAADESKFSLFGWAVRLFQ
ncbi:MAG TPA: hypothetical protein VK254_04770 [Candidatus Bathyarchaeia archaeon]|nr:hypothetical protein [Candidatus Bathyarchaeia archaeon]